MIVFLFTNTSLNIKLEGESMKEKLFITPEYTTAKETIKYGTVLYNGVKSKNFLSGDRQIITLERLFQNFFGESLYKSLYRIIDFII